MKDSDFRRQPQQQRSQERVEQIVKAAAEVFWEVGYEAATTHAIARQAETAVGTLYRFFPNKLAIFHELEKRHRQGVEVTHARMITPEFMQQPLANMIQQMVETYASYFEDAGHKVVYVQYYLSPEIFVHFDNMVEQSFIQRFACGMRMSNKTLSVKKSELIAEVCHRSFNALLLSALRSDEGHRALLYDELKQLLISYLSAYVGDRISFDQPVNAPAIKPISIAHPQGLNSRQQAAWAYLEKHGILTIQIFESLCPERSRRTLQRDLKQLINRGLLQSEGDTSQLIYRIALARKACDIL
ncbi:MAG: TetR/AcrR family transcriptional regulator [Phormidesmis sp.]